MVILCNLHTVARAKNGMCENNQCCPQIVPECDFNSSIEAAETAMQKI